MSEKKYKRAITYGTYDLFHIGHLRLLKRIANLAEEVYVAVSSDEFNALKGKKCIVPFEYRKEIVESLRMVTKVIREPIVSSKVSYIAAMKPIRLALVDMQREMANSKNVILDGRDIGTYVLPNANVKIFQIASVECRAKRRYIENLEKGIPSTLEEITESVKKRDYIDSHRDFAPLRKAEDAVEIDTSDMTIEESVDAVLAVIKEKTGIEIPCH